MNVLASPAALHQCMDEMASEHADIIRTWQRIALKSRNDETGSIRNSGFKHMHNTYDILTTHRTLGHLLSALCTSYHVATLEKDAVNNGIHADFTHFTVIAGCRSLIWRQRKHDINQYHAKIWLPLYIMIISRLCCTALLLWMASLIRALKKIGNIIVSSVSTTLD